MADPEDSAKAFNLSSAKEAGIDGPGTGADHR
jgi:hypothetical protein